MGNAVAFISLEVAKTHKNNGNAMYAKRDTDGALKWYQRARVIQEERLPIPWQLQPPTTKLDW
jgi:hypothetical protein